MEIYKALKKIEERFGIDAVEEIRNMIWKQQEKIKELTKSRDNWRNKFNVLKDEKK